MRKINQPPDPDAAREAVKAWLERRPSYRWRRMDAWFPSLVETTVTNVLAAEEREAAVVELLRAAESRQHSYDATLELAKYWAGSLPADVRVLLLPEGFLNEVAGDVLDEPIPASLLTFLGEVARGERTRPKRWRGRSRYENLLRDEEVAELVLIAGRVGKLFAVRNDNVPLNKRNSACDIVAKCLPGYDFDRVKAIWKKHARWRRGLSAYRPKAAGKLPPRVKLSDRHCGWSEAAVDAWLAEHPLAGGVRPR